MVYSPSLGHLENRAAPARSCTMISQAHKLFWLFLSEAVSHAATCAPCTATGASTFVQQRRPPQLGPLLVRLAGSKVASKCVGRDALACAWRMPRLKLATRVQPTQGACKS